MFQFLCYNLLLINPSRRSQGRHEGRELILYPHGFLDVVLPDDLSRAVHVPLQTSNQLSAETQFNIMRLNIKCDFVGYLIEIFVCVLMFYLYAKAPAKWFWM